jgi:hypothetical protein
MEELNTIITSLGIPVEAGGFSGKPPDEFIVITPLIDMFALYADGVPGADIQEARISLYTKGNPRQTRDRIIRTLLGAGITITDRAYIEFEQDTRLHHYQIDAAKHYMWE